MPNKDPYEPGIGSTTGNITGGSVLGTSTNAIYGNSYHTPGHANDRGGSRAYGSLISGGHNPLTDDHAKHVTPPALGGGWSLNRIGSDILSGVKKVTGVQNSVIDSIGNAALRPFSALGSLFGNGSSTPGADMNKKPVSGKYYGKEKLPLKDNTIGNIAKKITK